MIVFALWLITSTVHTQLAVYPSLKSCVLFSEAVKAQINQPPRPVLGSLVCVPVVYPGSAGETEKQGFGI